MKQYIPAASVSKKLYKEDKKNSYVVILGNPNSGKTALFNRLTGLHQKISNFPGVTVEKKRGWVKNENILIEDLPGSYSLKAQSLDEKIVTDYVQSWRLKKNRPDAVVVVIDATNFARNIFFALQILDWQLPTILVLNMIDEARDIKLTFDLYGLQKRLNAVAVIEASAKSGEGINEIVSAIKTVLKQKEHIKKNPVLLKLDDRHYPLQELIDYLIKIRRGGNILPLIDSIRLVADDAYISFLAPFLNHQ